jgi:hypothetical protein
LAHDLDLEFYVLREGDTLVVGVIEQECERELGRPAATIPNLESAWTVI